MFTDSAQVIIDKAKDFAFSRGHHRLNVEALLAAIGGDKKTSIRLAECWDKVEVNTLRTRCPDLGSPSTCPGTMSPDNGMRSVLQIARELASGEGIPDNMHPGLIATTHLICATAMSPEAIGLLGEPFVPIARRRAIDMLTRWMNLDDDRWSLGELTVRLRELRSQLLSKVFGQDHAVHAIVEGLYNSQVTAYADHDRRQPTATFVFAGPPGVGKTYLAELCASHLQRPFKRFDMTAFGDYSAERILHGFEPSYQGAKPGLLTGFVKQYPNAILLFDEIEKAHLHTVNLFYQILDAGRLHDKFYDELVCFRDTIIIFTTNAGRNLYENPNATGISAINADYHKKTILSALAHERNSVTGQPMFPPAICSRLSQGYPIMFNHLGVNELERIADAEMIRTESLLERQYFKSVRHDPLVPTALVLRHGANIDARQLRSEAENFVKSELFKFCNLYESERIDTALEQFDDLTISVDTSAITNTSDIARLFFNQAKSRILAVVGDEFFEQCRHAAPELEWIIAKTQEDVVSQLAAHEVDAVLVDLWVSAKPGEMLASHSQASMERNVGDGILPGCGVDHTPISAKALNTGRSVLHAIRRRFSEVPVYLLSFQPYEVKQASKTACIDNRVDSYGPTAGTLKRRAIDDELFLACVRAGGARGMLSTAFAFGDPESEESFTEALRSILQRLYREKVARGLARQRQCLNFDTSIRIDSGSRHVTILARGFSARQVIDSEDAGEMINDIDRPVTRFDDVFGATAAKQSLGFVVDWLKNPKRFLGLGLRPPKGILLTGPPGTGKTMLARAVAGESNCAYLEESGGCFVTKYQGSGSENVRELFERARKYAPAIVFIDEIDAVGRVRSGSEFSAERDNTLNTLLTEMDGFGTTTHAPIIVLAATNLADKLDPALKRRFDREIKVEEPDRATRLAFLQHVTKGIPKSEITLAAMEAIANQSVYMTLADLGRVVQEAGVMAALQSTLVNDAILLEAFEKQRMGEASPCKNPTTLLRIARHEAGHTFVAWKSGTPIHQVTIVGRGGSGGYMEQKHADEAELRTKQDMLREIRICMAGRAAELVYYGPEEGLSTGVGVPRLIGGSGGGDLPRASQLAIQMVRVYGMNVEFGQIAADELAANNQRPLIDRTLALAETIVSEQLEIAKSIIQAQTVQFNQLVDQLVQHNRLDELQLTNLLGKLPETENLPVPFGR